ncbi:MAG: phage holin family protein [Chlorobiaceae bacterium]|nr:phage holin family protein [Chlorobiaceae bacterium]NTW74333.1 phage holin family protein [Chlorobiaceae bacterium]
MTDMKRDIPTPRDRKKGIPGLIENTVSSTYDDMMAIIEAKLELIRIELTEKVALVGALLVLLVVFMIGTAYFITSAALLVGELLGHPFLGYLFISLMFISAFAFFTRIRPDMLKNFIHKILLSANDYRK